MFVRRRGGELALPIGRIGGAFDGERAKSRHDALGRGGCFREGPAMEQQFRLAVAEQFQYLSDRQAKVERYEDRPQLAAGEIEVEILDTILGQAGDAIPWLNAQRFAEMSGQVGRPRFQCRVRVLTPVRVIDDGDTVGRIAVAAN